MKLFFFWWNYSVFSDQDDQIFCPFEIVGCDKIFSESEIILGSDHTVSLQKTQQFKDPL